MGKLLSLVVKLMNSVTINGKTYRSSRSISVVNGVVKVDGKVIDHGDTPDNVLTVKVEGVLQSLKADGDVVAGLVQGNVDAGGSVSCDDVDGYVDAGGSVNCGNVGRYVDAGGSVNCGTVGGNVDAGGSVRHG